MRCCNLFFFVATVRCGKTFVIHDNKVRRRCIKILLFVSLLKIALLKIVFKYFMIGIGLNLLFSNYTLDESKIFVDKTIPLLTFSLVFHTKFHCFRQISWYLYLLCLYLFTKYVKYSISAYEFCVA